MTRKPFEPQDSHLWEEVKTSIAPLRKSKRRATKATASAVLVKMAPAISAAPNFIPARPSAYLAAPPPLASFERRTAQRLGRGQLEPEARLDLHGHGLENARIALLHFLSSRRMQGLRMVLVITGKGASPFARHTLHTREHFHTPEREGKLRREVPLWLEEAQFRIHVVGFQPAHPRHGGGGAFYVKLRKSGHVGE
jgi:DNA-nicking Smr family endonuclease